MLLVMLKADGKELLFPPRVEFLSLYRAIIQVATVPYEGGLVFYKVVPLQGKLAVAYDVFSIHSLPSKTENSSLHLKFTSLHKYLSILGDRQYYHLSEGFSECCKSQDLLICPPTGPLYSIQTRACELDLFLDRSTLPH